MDAQRKILFRGDVRQLLIIRLVPLQPIATPKQ